MKLFWGIPENTFKPLLFDGDKLRVEDADKEILRLVNRKKVGVKKISTTFIMNEQDANNLMSHYGIVDIWPVIGRRECREIIYEADIHD